MEKAEAERLEQERLNAANAKEQSKKDSIKRLLEEGANFDKQKEYARAASAYSGALRLDPNNMSIYFRHGWSSFKAGSTRDGLSKMKEAIDAGVNDPESLGKLGEILMREGPDQDLGLTERLLQSSVEQDGQNPETLVWLGRVYEK